MYLELKLPGRGSRILRSSNARHLLNRTCADTRRRIRKPLLSGVIRDSLLSGLFDLGSELSSTEGAGSFLMSKSLDLRSRP